MLHYPIKFTQDLAPYKELNVPHFHYKHNWLNNAYYFPFALKFNHTYYKYDNGTLVAFRILAYTIDDEHKNRFEHPLYFLVQLPNQPLQWISGFINRETKVYNSVEDYVTSGGANYVSLNWETWWVKYHTTKKHDDTHYFEGEFWTIKKGAVVKSASGAWYNALVMTEDGLFVNIAPTSYNSHWSEEGIYLDKMVATRTLLKDMTITDFENEPITIKMNILDNTPKYTKIMFVE